MSTYGLQVRAPDEIRGRILAADFAFVTLILSVTTTAAGGLASIVGPRPTIATFALLGVLAGTTYLLLTRHLRRQLAQDEAEAARTAATAPVGGPRPGRGFRRPCRQPARTSLSAWTRVSARMSPLRVESIRFIT